MLFMHLAGAVKDLENSRYPFFLTGGRYFGYIEDHVEWEFFAEDCAEVRKELNRLGFSVVGDLTAGNTFAHYGAVMVYVDLVANVDLKIKAQELLKPFMSRFPAECRDDLWDLANRILREQSN
jgi:hypothetical protein